MMGLVPLQGDGGPELSLPDEGRARSCPAKKEESSHQKQISLNLDLEHSSLQNCEECISVVKNAQSRDGPVAQWLSVHAPLWQPEGSQVQIPDAQ